MVAKQGRRAVVLMPVDWLRWSEDFHKSVLEIRGRARAELRTTTLELRLSGTATEGARAGLGRLGIALKEKVVAGLSVAPAAHR
jgi:hypothetical protein